MSIWDSLKYDHDVLIEASAGTGKTFTLQHIVKKLVCDNHVPPQNILLVTYTEKAVGELRDRIRQILQDENGTLPEGFEEMNISTIHSFCQKLLTEYAFENGVPMQFTVIGDDSDLIRKSIVKFMKSTQFQEKCGSQFNKFLNVFEFSSVDEWVKSVSEEIKKLIRTGQKSTATSGADYDASVKKMCNDLSSSAGKLINDGADSLFDSVKAAYSLTNRNRTMKEFCENVEMNILQKNVQPEDMPLESFPIKKIKKAREDSILKKINGGNAFHEKWKNFLDSLTACQNFISQVAVNTSYEIFLSAKKDMSVFSFDDLVIRSYQIIKREFDKEQKGVKSDFLSLLRQKYKIVLVDEFQDTDSSQWNIFRILFSRKNNPEGFLLAVGDPKQAIYGFRGADIAAYLIAREYIKDGNPAYCQNLSETYRCTRSMVNAFNTFFPSDSRDQPGWFNDMTVSRGDATYRIEYAPVSYPQDGNPEFDCIPEGENPNPVEFLESVSPKYFDMQQNGNRCIPVYMRNAAQEIKKLVSGKLNFPVKDKSCPDGKRYAFKYRDICFLARGGREIRIIMKELSKAGIPFSYYKEKGIFSSSEAENIIVLFDFLSDSSKTGNLAAVLLTHFFDVSPNHLEREIQNLNTGFFRKIDYWKGLIKRKEWSILFDSFMNETKMAYPKKDDFDFDRRWAASRQIFDTLYQSKGQTAAAISEFGDLLREWKKSDTKSVDNDILRQKESEDDRVQVMTMHASKGLEFPIVFLPAGFSKIKTGETIEEMERLLYVAITRAKYKIYLPWTKYWDDLQKCGLGSQKSPLNYGFLYTAIRKYLEQTPQNEQSVIDYDSTGIKQNSPEMPVSGRNFQFENTDVNSNEITPDPVILDKEQEQNLRKIKHFILHWDSYSSVSRNKSDKKLMPENPNNPDENTADADGNSLDNEQKTDILLPHGVLAGTIFHEIMEILCMNPGTDWLPGFEKGKLSYEDFTNDAGDANRTVFELIRRVMKKYSLQNQIRGNMSTEKTIAGMIWSALNKQIKIGNVQFYLKDIPAEDRRAEVKFVVNEKQIIPDCINRDGSFNGSIDLLVRIRHGETDQYYIFDWKTNSLKNGYDDDNVKSVMEEADYLLQYRLYCLAASKWLGGEAVAGAVYLFVRGGENGKDCGIYTEEFTEEHRQEAVDYVTEKIRGCADDTL